MNSASGEGVRQRKTLQRCHNNHACASLWKPLPPIACAKLLCSFRALPLLFCFVVLLFSTWRRRMSFLVAAWACGECFCLFCVSGDDVMLTNGSGVVLLRVRFCSHSSVCETCCVSGTVHDSSICSAPFCTTVRADSAQQIVLVSPQSCCSTKLPHRPLFLPLSGPTKVPG